MENLTYKWNLATANFTKNKGNVFSCFACGGGSTMVPPLMIARIANEVYKQWLTKI